MKDIIFKPLVMEYFDIKLLSSQIIITYNRFLSKTR